MHYAYINLSINLQETSKPPSVTLLSAGFYQPQIYYNDAFKEFVGFCGGVANDVHWLEGDNDGLACESLCG